MIAPKLVMPPRDTTSEALFSVRFFGKFTFSRANSKLPPGGWRRHAAQRLFKWFLLHPGRHFSTEQLISTFWPEIAPEIAQSSLHVNMHFLRRLLEPTLAPYTLPCYLQRDRQGAYWLDMDDHWDVDLSDVQRLREAARASHEQGDELCEFKCYQRLIGATDAGFLPEDVYDEVFSSFHSHYSQIRSNALARFFRLGVHLRHYGEVQLVAYRQLTLDRFDEDAAVALAYVTAAEGEQTRALAELDRFVEGLRMELGSEPGPSLRRLYRSLAVTAGK